MSNNAQQKLFREYDLDGYLRQKTQNLENEIKNLSLKSFNEIDEKDLVNQFFTKYYVSVPTLNEDKIDINAQEAMVTVGHGDSRIDFDDGPVTLPGLSITVKIPFKGLEELFSCKPSTIDISGTPDAQVENDILILYYNTTEKDAEKIKGLWKGDIKTIKKNLERIERDVANYNNFLENNIKVSLTRRKKEIGENKILIDKLKE